MILLPIVTGLIGVGQTYLNNVIGQNVMQDLRGALYAHLQAMPLRFFTETRTGEIQSRLANDVGGVQAVVTDTASSVTSNIAVAISTIIAMFFIDWRLTLLSLGLTPFFLFLTYRVGKVRREVSTETQQSLAELTAHTEETLSVSGILLAKTFGQQANSIAAFRDINARLAVAPDPPGDGRPLVLHDHRHDLQHHPGLRVLAGRLPDHPGRPVGADDRRHRRLHDAPVAAVLPARPAAQRAGRGPGRAGPLRPHLRVPRDGSRDRRRAGRRGRSTGRPCAARSASATSRFHYPTAAVPPSGPTSAAAGRGGVAGGAVAEAIALAAAPVDLAALDAAVDDLASPEAEAPEVAPIIEPRPAVRPRGHRLRGRARRAGRPGRPVGQRQDHDDLPHPAAVRRRRRRGRDRRASTSAASSSPRSARSSAS